MLKQTKKGSGCASLHCDRWGPCCRTEGQTETPGARGQLPRGCLVPDGHGQLPSESSEPAGCYGQDPSGRRPWMVAVSPVSFREAEPRDTSERCPGGGLPAGSPEELSQSRSSTTRSFRCPGQLPVRGGLLGISETYRGEGQTDDLSVVLLGEAPALGAGRARERQRHPEAKPQTGARVHVGTESRRARLHPWLQSDPDQRPPHPPGHSPAGGGGVPGTVDAKQHPGAPPALCPDVPLVTDADVPRHGPLCHRAGSPQGSPPAPATPSTHAHTHTRAHVQA